MGTLGKTTQGRGVRRGALAGSLALAVGLALAPPPAAAAEDRKNVDYTVRPGDTATGIATRLPSVPKGRTAAAVFAAYTAVILPVVTFLLS